MDPNDRVILRRKSDGSYYIKDKGWVGETEKEATQLTKVEYEFRRQLYHGIFKRKIIKHYANEKED